MVDDIVVNKAAIIERCLDRVRQEYAALEGTLAEDITRQDSILLNIQRACEAAIDLAMHIVRVERLGVPQESREAFSLLESGAKLDSGLSDSLQRMVGFRNVAIHDYRSLDLDIVQSIIIKELGTLRDFSTWAIQHFS